MPLHSETPLLHSATLSNLTNLPIYLKLENTQPAGSFKIRGLGNLIEQAEKRGYNHVVCASGGNAGLATAYAAKQMNINATVFVPQTTSQQVRKLLKIDEATVIEHGRNWGEADKKAQEFAQEKGYFHAPPFDHPDVWAGNASLVHELKQQLKNEKPRCVVTAVGGAGLFCGVVQGLEEVGWADVPVIAMETIGADVYSKSIAAGKPVILSEITSVCVCLGASFVPDIAVEYYKTRPIISKVIEDKQAIESCVWFADDHRVLVESACGAALSSVYHGIIEELVQENKIPSTGPVVVVVCGGSGVNLTMLEQWRNQFSVKFRE